LRKARAITIYDTRTGSTETIAKAIEEGRKKLELRLYQRACKCKAEDPKDTDGQPTA
jgi:flavodoxin